MIPPHTSQPSPQPCHTCGTAMPADSPEGHCAACLCRFSIFAEEAAEQPEGTPWTRLGDCDLYEELGRGGMGIVYRGRHRRLGSQVAVKVLRGGELAEPSSRRRFQAEAETAARLQHPGIVSIHDSGEEQGVCWFSMELIAGRTLDQVVRHQPLKAVAAATCLHEVTVAVIYAHKHGVLHRDLKPSNIILDVDNLPHITDFGIARCMDVATATRSGAAIGSPGYAAPEQVNGSSTDVRTDVYGLGSVMYHVLTGRPPYVGPTTESILVQMQDHDPLRLRALSPTVPLDLETICLKALAREPDRRYATAKEFSDDLEHFLNHRPISARPVSWLERTWRWACRRPAWAALLGALILALGLGAAGITWQWRKAVQNLVAETAAREGLEKNTYAADLRAASLAILDQNQWAIGRALLARHTHSRWQGVEWRLLWHASRPQEVARLLPDHPVAVSAAALHEGEASALAATADSDGRVRFWDFQTMQPSPILPLTLQSAVNTLSFLPDGRLLTGTEKGGVTAWDLGPRVAVASEKWPGTMAATSADGTILATTVGEFHSWINKPGRVRVWSPSTSSEPWEVPEKGQWIALSPDGARLVLAGAEGGLSLWDVPSRKKSPYSLTHGNKVWRPVFSSDGLRLAACHAEGAWLWQLPPPTLNNPIIPVIPVIPDSTVPEIEGNLLPHPLHVWAVKFLPEPQGSTLITACADRILRGWDEDGGPRHQPAFSIPGSPDELWCLAISRDGTRCLTGVKGGSVHVWANTGRTGALEIPSSSTHPRSYSSVSFSAKENLTLVTYANNQPANIWRCGPKNGVSKLHECTQEWIPLGFSSQPGPTSLWCYSNRGNKIQLRSAATQEPCGPSYPLPLPVFAHAGLSTDASAVFFMDREQQVRVLSLVDGAVLGAFQLQFPPAVQPALSKGGAYLAVNPVGNDGPLYLVEVASGKYQSLQGHRYTVNGVAFSPDGTQLASVASDAKLKIWDTATATETFTTTAHLAQASGVAWSPDSNTLATISEGEGFKLWHPATGRELLSWNYPAAAKTIGFSPDGQWLAVGLNPSSSNSTQWLLETPMPEAF